MPAAALFLAESDGNNRDGNLLEIIDLAKFLLDTFKALTALKKLLHIFQRQRKQLLDCPVKNVNWTEPE